MEKIEKSEKVEKIYFLPVFSGLAGIEVAESTGVAGGPCGANRKSTIPTIWSTWRGIGMRRAFGRQHESRSRHPSPNLASKVEMKLRFAAGQLINDKTKAGIADALIEPASSPPALSAVRLPAGAGVVGQSSIELSHSLKCALPRRG